MITILWQEKERRNWEVFEDDGCEADRFMESIRKNKDVKYDDIIIFFTDSFGVSCYGESYNVPIGAKILKISEGATGTVLERRIGDDGINYKVKFSNGAVGRVWCRNLEVICY